MAVVDAADEYGSTDYIVKAIAAAPAGSTFAIGTEINLVQRLAAEYPQHTIFCLDSVVCPCSTMYRIHPGYLAWVLEGLVRGEVLNRSRCRPTVAEPGPRRARADARGASRDTTMAALTWPRVVVVGSGDRRADRRPRGRAARHEVTVVTKARARREQHRVRPGRHRGGACSPTTASPTHVADTLRAGAGLGDRRGRRGAVRARRPTRIRDLIALGVRVRPRRRTTLARGLEAAHSRARVLHAGGDATGRRDRAGAGRALCGHRAARVRRAHVPAPT